MRKLWTLHILCKDLIRLFTGSLSLEVIRLGTPWDSGGYTEPSFNLLTQRLWDTLRLAWPLYLVFHYFQFYIRVNGLQTLYVVMCFFRWYPNIAMHSIYFVWRYNMHLGSKHIIPLQAKRVGEFIEISAVNVLSRDWGNSRCLTRVCCSTSKKG